MTGNIGKCGELGERANGSKSSAENRRKSRKRNWTYVDFARSIGDLTAHKIRRLVRVGALTNRGAHQRFDVVRTRQNQEVVKFDVSRASESALTSISDTSPEAQARGYAAIEATRRMPPRLRVGAGVLWCAVLSLTAVCSSAAAKETLVRNVPEFDAAVKAAGPGDTIVLADGEWRDADLVFRGEGAVDNPIRLKPQNPGKVTFLGTSRLRMGGEGLYVEGLLWRDSSATDDVISFRIDSKTMARKCTLAECAIVGDNPDKERKFVSIYGEGNIVYRCRFDGKKSRGTLLVVWLGESAPPNHHLIKECFFGPRERLGKNGGEIIRIGDSKTSLQESSTEVSSNYFYRCDGEAEIISNKSCKNLYAGNVFVGCSGALTLRHGNEVEVRDNAFFGDGRKGTGGVRVIGERHFVSGNFFYELTGDDTRAAICVMNGIANSPLNACFPVRDVEISLNTFFRCKETFVIGAADEDQPEQTVPPRVSMLCANYVETDGRPIFIVRTKGSELTSDRNTFVGGPLGLEDSLGWNQRSEPAGEREEAALEILRVKPTDCGPDWMKPGEEFLPEVVRRLRAKEGTLAKEKK
jgi:poly(beta-D-mannuronate) lyase